MSINIMDMVKGAVSKEVMGKLGGLLGQTDPKKTTSVFETATGSILGGLIKKASTPSGAKDVFGQIQQSDSSILDNLGGLLGGGSANKGMLESGGGLLDSIFGGGNSRIFDIIAKHVGLDSGMVAKLMKIVAPIVMGVLGKHIKSKGMDAVGLGSLLSSQKSVLSNVLPPSLGSALGFGDLMGSASGAMKNAGAAFSKTANQAGRATADTASSGGMLLKILLPLILLGAIAWFGYDYFVKNAGDSVKGTNDIVKGTGDMDKDVSTGAAMPKIGSFDVSGLKGKFEGITTGLKNVTTENAGELTSKIKDLTGSLDSMGLDKMTGAAKTAVSGVIGTFIDSIQAAIDRISDEGILGMLKPAVKSLVDKLKAYQQDVNRSADSREN